MLLAPDWVKYNFFKKWILFAKLSFLLLSSFTSFLNRNVVLSTSKLVF